jgi:hypothetical protein
MPVSNSFQFLSFIILIIARAGYEGNMVSPLTVNGIIINCMISYGLFVVVLIQLVAILVSAS